ncbi:hypothetical protein DEU56DRAFT_261593 [Suillus clintonianus]|uniref:uncharacterized protein n=1 Tax=Suillus clintonianus TaxID=1904413 RepID=UPI001B87E1C2|nr:uncharacterized protein DEU56DRAFT_261593 [Suillus clintonianus]KAG2142407.1 hypothetical protein DEU56DRAFT_261593 [Suillus clintonianus]
MAAMYRKDFLALKLLIYSDFCSSWSLSLFHLLYRPLQSLAISYLSCSREPSPRHCQFNRKYFMIFNCVLNEWYDSVQQHE